MMVAPDKIKSLERSIKGFTENYKIKINDLTHKRYRPEEIERILPVEEHDKKISDTTNEISILKMDYEALQSFVADKPNYDISIIENTLFYKHFMANEEFFRGLS